MRIRRRSALVYLGFGTLLVGVVGTLRAQVGDLEKKTTKTGGDATKPQKPPAVPDEEVREFLGAAHGKIERVKEMLAARPSIVNAVWDWGGGDFESGLNAASHMGRADIARELLRAGARLDLFAAAMLGNLPVVKAALDAEPWMLETRGAHGITLLAHAEKGGDEAKSVAEYLKSLKKPGG